MRFKHLLIIFVTAIFIVVGAWQIPFLQAESDREANNESSDDTVYFTIDTDSLVSQEDIVRTNVLLVTTFESLDETLKDNPTIRFIYFHPDALGGVENGWLKEQYKKGKVLAVIDAPISQLTQKLGGAPEIEDFRLGDSMGRIGISVVQLLDNEESRTEGHHHYQDFLVDFQQIHLALQKAFPANTIPPDPGPAPLGFDQWTDSYGTLTGSTWFNHESSGGFVWHYGHAYSSYNHTPYWIRVRVDTYNTF